MTFDISTPTLLIYGDGTGRLLNPAELPRSLEDVCTRYMEDDLLIDGRGRVFKLSQSEKQAQTTRLIGGELEPIDITDRFTETEVDDLLASTRCADPTDLHKVVSAIRLSRQATW